MPPENQRENKRLAQSEVEKLEPEDLMDYLYGSIQAIIERNAPSNVAFHYFMPSVPFGPELGVFMDIGQESQTLDNEDESGNPRFTVNDMMRAAVNFAAIVDYIPVISSKKANDADDGDVVSMNNLVSSGNRISTLYESILRTGKVVDNARTSEEEERLNKLRAALYKEPPSEPEDEEVPEEDDLLSGLEDDEDVDLADLMSDGAETSDFVEDPNAIAEPTKPMQLYQALEAFFYQVQARELDKISKISPNDPNGGIKIKAAKNRIRTARRRWEAQGRKTQIEGILARIEQLSQAGMVQYISDLRERLRGNEILASVFSSEEEGLGALTEEAYYTALRPNGILDAPGMELTISNQNTASWSRFERKRSSGSVGGFLGGLIGGARASKLEEDRERAFFREGFEIRFEIVQGIIDRPWLDLGFIESPAYTTVDPKTDKPLDVVKQITTLSDGKTPPETGLMPAIPVTAYFIKNLKVKSSAFSSLGESEREKFSGRGGVKFLGLGARASHDNETVEGTWSFDSTSGTLEMDGTFLIGMSSRYLKEAPNPDFESFPNADDWIGA